MTGNIGKYDIEYIDRKEFLHLKKEIFTQQIYKTELRGNPTIIDAGAHIGLASLYFRKEYPGARITAIEPNPTLFKLLQKNLELHNIKTIDKALAKAEGTMDFFIDNAGTWYSTGGKHIGAWNGLQQSRKIEVPTITLSSLLKKPVDLLKLDIEGSEMEVIKQAREELKLVENIITEFHPNRDNKLEKYLSILEKSGYKNTVNEGEQGLYLVYSKR